MPPADVEKRIVSRFLERCNRYASEQLERYHRDARHKQGLAALEIQDKISHWTAYQVFNEYTLAELADGTLDDWFDDDGS
ncbi:MAG: hypothetical protein KJO55_04850 [Gammaproteobacteria bacterium]|nr:hypothetical protein [Gammaproteobacteria bacterium]NND60007.1 hypothetical protein [Gammaproteobacteria bacterium]